MRKVRMILLVVVGATMVMSCGEEGEISEARLVDERTMEDEIIELNWNRAVKDLYFFEDDGEVAKN